MKAAFQWLGNLLVAVSIGTLASVVILLAMLWWKGALADGRVLGRRPARQGIGPRPPAKDAAKLDPDSEQPSIEQLLHARLRTSLDLDLRESAVDKALGDLRALESQIKSETS